MSEFPNWFEITAQPYFEKYLPDKPLKVLQVGVFTGDATAWLLENKDIIELHDVDTWQGSDEEAHSVLDFAEVESYYRERFANKKQVRAYKMTSDLFFAKALAAEEKYDFIYIDGDHTATQVAIDGLNAFRCVESGGIIAFDDLTWKSGLGDFHDPEMGIRSALTIWQNKYKILAAGSQLWIERL